MTHDRLQEQLRELDPAGPDQIAAASRGAEEIRRRILAEPFDELTARRRERRRRVGVALAAAAVAAALLIPLLLLLPLGDDDGSIVGNSSTATPTASPSPSPSPEPTPTKEPGGGRLDPIEVTAPERNAAVTSPVTISGTADVFEATVSIRILDEMGNVIQETFTTAACGTGCRGDYTETVRFSVDGEQAGTIQVFEFSAKDGSMINVVRIPVTLMPS